MHELVTDEERIEVHQVLARYGHVIDRRDTAGLAEVFTADAVFDTSSVGGGVYRGMAELHRFLELGDAVHPPFHLLTNAWVYREGATMKSMSKWLTIDRDTGLPRSGDYLDSWRPTERGWQIFERIAQARWPGGPWNAGYDG